MGTLSHSLSTRLIGLNGLRGLHGWKLSQAIGLRDYQRVRLIEGLGFVLFQVRLASLKNRVSFYLIAVHILALNQPKLLGFTRIFWRSREESSVEGFSVHDVFR